jgi:hypothetical protein
VFKRPDAHRELKAAQILGFRRRAIADMKGDANVSADTGRIRSRLAHHPRCNIDSDPAINAVCKIDQLPARPAAKIDNPRPAQHCTELAQIGGADGKIRGAV